MPDNRMQPCSRCKAIVPTDRKSCPIQSKDTFGDAAPPTPKAAAKGILQQPLVLALLAIGIVFWLWGGLVSLKSYDLQAVPREKAALVQNGMTHREVIDLLGRDAAPIPVWNGFQTSGDQSVRAISESAQASLETRKVSACSPDRDEACGAHYTLKDGSGLRLIYRRGIVIYASISYGYDRRPGR